MAETMLAAVVFEHGGYEKLMVTQVEKPQVQEPDDVIVRVRACALNHLDIFARKGTSGPAMRAKRLPPLVVWMSPERLRLLGQQ